MVKTKEITDLTQGNILSSLFKLALPLIGASFIQMAYTITDMFWLGNLSSESVAAAGSAYYFIWLCNALSMTTKIGAEIMISQSLGAKNKERASIYAKQSLSLALIIGTLYALAIFFSAKHLIGLFDFQQNIEDMGVSYLKIICPGLLMTFFNNTFAGLYNGHGDSSSPFKIITVGLIANIVLDPLLIYGMGCIPGMGCDGAALATLMSQTIVFLIFCKKIFSIRFPLGKMSFITPLNKEYSNRIINLGFPVCLQSGLFSMFSLTLSTMAANWGAIGVAAQSIGSQIESISWMSAHGFATALASFVGQNYGAGNFARINQGYKTTMMISGSIGFISSMAFYIFSEEIFRCFVNEAEAVKAGSDYLKILSVSQLFMITEIVTMGAFNGCGKTKAPAIIGIILTGLRIPFAYILCSIPELGLNGIWISVSISSILKGSVSPIWWFVRKKTYYRN